jgi:hypothetical protein
VLPQRVNGNADSPSTISLKQVSTIAEMRTQWAESRGTATKLGRTIASTAKATVGSAPRAFAMCVQ